MDLDTAEVTFGGSTAVVHGHRVEGTTKGGRSRTINIDTVAVLRGHRRQQAEERQAAGSAWADNGGLVFDSRWGEPLYPDTVTALMGKLISQHNKSAASPAAALPHARLHDLRHLHATSCSPEFPSMWSRPAWVMPTRPSPCGSTRTCSTSTQRGSGTSSPRP